MSEAQRTAAAEAGPIERWSLPKVEGRIIGRPVDDRKAAAVAAAAAEAIARLAREEAEKRGYEAGMAQATREMQGRIAELDARLGKLDALLQFMARPLQELDGEVERMLLQLALTVGKQLARRELRIDPTQVIAIIRESLEHLPTAAREIRVHLHPEDAAVVRERLTTPSSDRAWTLVEDPTQPRGGCLIRSENSQIDARFESRVTAVVANALGDERSPERAARQDDPATPTQAQP